MPYDLPHDVRALFHQAAQRDLGDPIHLAHLVRHHVQAARKAASHSGLLDLDLAVRVGEGCLALLESWPQLIEPHRRLVQATCLYFTESHDDEDDFASVIGFEDDAEVLNHVTTRLGRPDLLIELE